MMIFNERMYSLKSQEINVGNRGATSVHRPPTHSQKMTFEALDVDEGTKNGVLIQLRHHSRLEAKKLTRVQHPKYPKCDKNSELISGPLKHLKASFRSWSCDHTYRDTVSMRILLRRLGKAAKTSKSHVRRQHRLAKSDFRMRIQAPKIENHSKVRDHDSEHASYALLISFDVLPYLN